MSMTLPLVNHVSSSIRFSELYVTLLAWRIAIPQPSLGTSPNIGPTTTPLMTVNINKVGGPRAV